MRYITLYAILGQAWCAQITVLDLTLGETIETALQDVLTFIIIYMAMICLYHSPAAQRIRNRRGADRTMNTEAPDREGGDKDIIRGPQIQDLPICPSCNRRYTAVEDADGHMICQWCGHIEERYVCFIAQLFKNPPSLHKAKRCSNDI